MKKLLMAMGLIAMLLSCSSYQFPDSNEGYEDSGSYNDSGSSDSSDSSEPETISGYEVYITCVNSETGETVFDHRLTRPNGSTQEEAAGNAVRNAEAMGGITCSVDSVGNPW